MREVAKLARLFAGVILLTFFLSLSLDAQMNVGRIVGTVTDSSGAVITSATVTAANQGTGLTLTAQTTSGGLYTLNEVPIGRYTITIGTSGFETYRNPDVQVVSGETVTLDAKLVVGQVTQTINVTSNLPLIDTSQSTEGTSRTNAEIEALPITLYGDSARSAAALAKTMDGVSYDPAESGGQEFMEISRANINGVDAGMWAYNIDGVDAGTGNAERGHDMAPPTPEVIQEVSVTANADASESFSPGVSLELTEKSGTSKFHGDFYEYNRNQALEARNFFLAKVPQDSQNNYGITIGGPVYIPWLPKLFGKDKTFFFTNLDMFRFRTTLQGDQEEVTASVATQAMRNGDFSQLLGAQAGTDALGRPVYAGEIYDPATTRTLPNGAIVRDPYQFGGTLNVINPAVLSSVSLAVMGQEALPNQPGVASNWVGANAQTRVDKDQWFSKFDHNINNNNRFTFAFETVVPWFLFGETRGVTTGESGHSYIAGGPGYLGPAETSGFIDDRNQFRYRFNYVWTASPNLIVSFRTGITRTPARLLSYFPYTGAQNNFGKQIGLTGMLAPNDPTIGIQGYSGLGDGFTHFTTPNQDLPVTIDVNWVRGQHNFKFGMNWIDVHNYEINQGQGNGSFGFSNTETGLPGFSATGSGMSSFMTGYVNSASVGTPFTSYLQTGAWGWYFQDSWRLTKKLTLHYGLGWNIYIPAKDANNQIGTFDPTLANPGAGGISGALALYGTGAGRNGNVRVSGYYLKAFEPHLGIAYALNEKTVIRANASLTNGAGSWTTWTGGGLGPSLPTPGFSATLTPTSANNGVTAAYNWQNPFPETFPSSFPVNDPALENGTSLGFIDRNFDTPPLFTNVSLEVGRELPGAISLRLAYVGTFAHYLPTSNADNLDALPFGDYAQYGALLNSSATSPAAVAAGIHLPYTGFTGSVAQALLPFPQYLSVPVLNDPEGNSEYNAFQVNAQKRIGHGLSFLISYTDSKLVATSYGFATALSGGSIGGGFNTPIQAPYFKGTSHLIDPSDRPQMLNLSWTYDLPVGKGKRFASTVSPALDKVIGGWQFSAIQNYFGGRPIIVTTEASIPFAGLEPVRVPGQPFEGTACGNYSPFNSTGNSYLNAGAFTNPAPLGSSNPFGNIQEIPSLRQCGFMEEDFGLNKQVAVSERWKVRFGTLWQNAFNRHPWETLNTDTDSSTFGHYGAAYPARNIQLYARIEF